MPEPTNTTSHLLQLEKKYKAKLRITLLAKTGALNPANRRDAAIRADIYEEFINDLKPMP